MASAMAISAIVSSGVLGRIIVNSSVLRAVGGHALTGLKVNPCGASINGLGSSQTKDTFR
jgi:hypothetical protein